MSFVEVFDLGPWHLNAVQFFTVSDRESDNLVSGLTRKLDHHVLGDGGAVVFNTITQISDLRAFSG